MKRDGDMMSSIPKIKSSGIIVDYDGKRALHGIDLDIYPNEVTALIGPCLLYTSPSPRDS